MPSVSAAPAARVAPSSERRRVDPGLARRLSYYAMRPAEIEHRLAELDREWPIDRVLQAHAATLILGGVVLALSRDRRLLAVPVAVAAWLLQRALQGDGPPGPLFRWLGLRSAAEIDQERYALKALRGDFRDVAQAGAWQPAMAERAIAEPGTPAAIAQRDRAAGALAAVRR